MAIEPRLVDAGKPVGGGRIIKRRTRTQEQRNQAARRVTLREQGKIQSGLKAKQHEYKTVESRQSHGHKIAEREHAHEKRIVERGNIHNKALERDQIRASQRVQTARALQTLRSEHAVNETHRQTIISAKRNTLNAAATQPVGPQVSQGTGTVGGAVLRIFIALIAFSILYLVLVNSNQTSGLIKAFGTGLVGLSSDKTIFVKTGTK